MLLVFNCIKIQVRLESIGSGHSYFLFPSHYTTASYLVTDDEQLCVYTVSVNLLHKAGAKENIGPMQTIVLNGFLRALRGKLALNPNSLSLLLPHHGEIPLVTLSLC